MMSLLSLSSIFLVNLRNIFFIVDDNADDGKLKKVIRCQNNLWQKILGNSQTSGKITGFCMILQTSTNPRGRVVSWVAKGETSKTKFVMNYSLTHMVI